MKQLILQWNVSCNITDIRGGTGGAGTTRATTSHTGAGISLISIHYHKCLYHQKNCQIFSYQADNAWSHLSPKNLCKIVNLLMIYCNKLESATKPYIFICKPLQQRQLFLNLIVSSAFRISKLALDGYGVVNWIIGCYYHGCWTWLGCN